MRSGSQSPFNNALLSGGRSYGSMRLGADQRDRARVAAGAQRLSTAHSPANDAPTTTMRSMAMSFAHRPTIATMSETITLEGWRGPWPDDDKDANLKADIALYSHVDPLRTVRGLSDSIDVPVGAIVHYVLGALGERRCIRFVGARTDDVAPIAGASAPTQRPPDPTRRVWLRIEQLRQMISWLNYPLEHPEVYDI